MFSFSMRISGPRAFQAIRAATPIRGLHQTAVIASQRVIPFEKLLTKKKQTWEKETVPAEQLLENLKSLQSNRALNNHPDKSALYRDAHRDISCLVYSTPNRSMKDISLAALEEILSKENGVSWRCVADMVYAPGKEVEELALLSEEKRAAVRFNGVHGIGIVKAKKLAAEGYRTLDDIRRLRGLDKSSTLGLLHLEDMNKMVPRAEIDVFKGLLEESLKAADPAFNFEIMGSYRRGEAISSDIDLVVWHPSYQDREITSTAEALMAKVYRALSTSNILFDGKFFAQGKKKILALTHLPKGHPFLQGSEPVWRQIDIRICPVPSLQYMLLGNTGDDQLMKLLRGAAKAKGKVLNEYGMGPKKQGDKFLNSTMYAPGTEDLVESEEDIFKLLGVPYLPPTERSYRKYKTQLPNHVWLFSDLN